MIKKTQRAAVERALGEYAKGPIADFDVLDQIAARLTKHPERNPLRSHKVRELSALAIELWSEIPGKGSVGEDPDAYLEILLPFHPHLAARLEQRGYWSRPVESTTEFSESA